MTLLKIRWISRLWERSWIDMSILLLPTSRSVSLFHSPLFRLHVSIIRSKHLADVLVNAQDDIELVLNNARRYNKPETSYHKLAIQLGELAEPILSSLVETIDKSDSIVSVHSTELTKLLSVNYVDELFNYQFEEGILVEETPEPELRVRTPSAVIEEVVEVEDVVEEVVVEQEENEEVENVLLDVDSAKMGKGKENPIVQDATAEPTPKPKASRKRKVDEAILDSPTIAPRARRSSHIDPIPPTSKSAPTFTPTTRKAKVEDPDETYSGGSGIARKKGRVSTGKGRLSEVLKGAVSTPVRDGRGGSNQVKEVDSRESFKLFSSGLVFCLSLGGRVLM